VANISFRLAFTFTLHVTTLELQNEFHEVIYSGVLLTFGGTYQVRFKSEHKDGHYTKTYMSFGSILINLSKQNVSTGVLSIKLGHILMCNISSILHSCIFRVSFLRILEVYNLLMHCLIVFPFYSSS
jgi:hypothetical protein